MNISPTEQWIIKYKTMGWTDEQVAVKVGWEPEKVRDFWKDVQQVVSEDQSQDGQKLGQAFGILCQQYELVGYSLRVMSGILSSSVKRSDLIKCVVPNDPEATVTNILSKFHVTEHYKGEIDPTILLEEDIKRRNATG
ncbi:MAG: hypothetical protein Unbinned3891contig1000_74 [Prokaryotic dsDNA virus sp.]|nr:MAG: hypothetical protein Unbinned3891contig1000_74 [Prokaryotic dsDNA virus sp.]|tara:strand:- start:49882 stop:50295 length:414 start_codon:yes stop_codon:yes gene_type:complete